MAIVGSEQRERLLVDLSPAPPPDEDDLHAWAAGQSVFVSSVMAGMKDERQAAVNAIEAVGASPVWFESFGGMDDDPEEAYLGHVASSDIYVGILGVCDTASRSRAVTRRLTPSTTRPFAVGYGSASGTSTAPSTAHNATSWRPSGYFTRPARTPRPKSWQNE